MKVLLLQPPIRDFYQTDVRLQPLGLGYLKAALRKHAPEVTVVLKDYHSGSGRRTVAVPPELSYLRSFYPPVDRSPFRTFSRFYQFGAGFEQIAREVAQEQPDLIGISALFSAYSGEALETARAIKKELRVPIVLGGAHVSALPKDVLADEAVDFVVVGEGEKPFVDLVRVFRAESSDKNPPTPLKNAACAARFDSVPNLGFKRNGTLVINPPGPNFGVDDIPPPELEDLGLCRYKHSGLPIAFVITSRGCPYRCSFCSVSAVFGHGYRARSAASVCEEILLRYRQGYRVIDFEDDNLAFDPDRFSDILEGIMGTVPAGVLRLTAMNGICYHNLDHALLVQMRRAGFQDLNLSLVTADPQLARRSHRPYDLGAFDRVARLASELGFRVVGYQILGLPGDTVESMVETTVFLARLPLLIGASPFYLAPGSDWWCRLADGSETRSWIGARTTAMGWDCAEFGRGDIFTLFVTSRIVNFLKGIRFTAGRLNFEQALREAEKSSPTARVGSELLKTLLETGVLLAADGERRFPVERFNASLFKGLWSKLGQVVTQEGTAIEIGSSTA